MSDGTKGRRPTLVGLLAAVLVELGWLLATPALLVALLVASRGLTRPKLRRGLRDKLWCRAVRRGEAPGLWVHAVSVGEVLTAAPLVEALRERFPSVDVSLSVATYTGLETARRRLPGVEVFWAPLDYWLSVRRALKARRPAAILLVELELWPGLLIHARRHGVPVLVVNGRLSEPSCRGYERSGPVGRWLFSLVDAFSVQNVAYAERFARLGVGSERLVTLGNLKHDRTPTVAPDAVARLREELGWGPGSGAVVLVAGCTHPGEELALCAIVRRLRERFAGLRLVLAPRHVERLTGGEEGSWGADRPFVRWAEWSERPHALGDSILLVDTVGQLERIYGMADMVFVGGSLTPRGGHNVLEPAAWGRPVAVGPHGENFVDEIDALLATGGVVRASDAASLERVLGEWLEEPARRQAVGQAALEACRRLSGATERHLEWISARCGFFPPA